MKWKKYLFCLFLVFLGVRGLGDPYQILGVRKTASVQEIRKAYKQLAKEW